MREKLIDVFMHLDRHIQNRDEYGICYTSDFAEAVEIVLEMLESQDANGVTVQRWIPVTERLPEMVSTHKRHKSTVKRSIRVLCACVQESGKKMVKEGYCEWYSDYPEPGWQIPGTIDKVTHWMPLPQPPKEG